MLTWSLEKKILELKYTWKISRNASDSKTNFMVTVAEGGTKGMGEAAPNIRYNESPEELEKQFNAFIASQQESITSLPQLTRLLDSLTLSNCLRFAIESAYIHYQSSIQKKSVAELLGLQSPGEIFTAYSIPIMDIGRMKDFYKDNHLSRFRYIKIKVNAGEAFDAVDYVSRFCNQPLIVDANEAFTDVESCIYFLEKVKRKKIEFIEQPMPAALKDESIYLKKYSPFPLFADESITTDADFSALRKMFDGINVKLMKAGGYLNGVHLLKEARAAGMRTMIGCMVETTLAISSAMNLCSLCDYADLDSFLVVKNEPFGLIREDEGRLAFS